MKSPDVEQVRTVLRTLEGDRALRGIGRPNSGLTGNVFLLQTDREALVLRAFNDADAAWKPEKERIIYGLLRRLGVPVPNLLKTDLSRSLLPFAYVLSECLPGTTLGVCYSNLTTAQLAAIYDNLGDCLGRIHTLAFSAFGDVAEQNGVIVAGPARELTAGERGYFAGPFASWREMHGQIVTRHLQFLERTEFHDLVCLLDAWFSAHDFLLNCPVMPRLLHMDLHCGNVLVSDDIVTGILDVEESVIGHHEYDLMRTELAHFRDGEPDIQEVFFGAYAQHIKLEDGYEARKPFYELSRILVGLRCLVTYGSSYTSDVNRETHAVRQRISELINE